MKRFRLTRMQGMTHYGFWGKEYVTLLLNTPPLITASSHRYFTSPDLPIPEYVEGFQGNAIPIDGEVVARLCVERLTLASEVDD